VKPELDQGRAKAIGIASVVLAAILVYLNSLGNGFAYDDVWVIRDRDVVQDIGQIWRIVSMEYWPQIFQSGLYRPITLLSFAIDWALWGGNPFGFHLLNVLLHAAASGLAFVFLTRFFPWWGALAGGLVFAVHPVHTEVVANIVGRGELLAAIGILWAALVYTRAVRGRGLTAATILAIAALYALAGFSKEGGIVLPGLLLVTDLPLLARRQLGSFRDYARTRVPLLAVLTVVLGLLLAARWAVLGAAVENIPDPVFAIDHSFPTRFFTMARVWPRYLELLMVPVQLSADYGPAIILPVKSITILGLAGLLAVIALGTTAVVLFRRAPEFAMALAWFAVGIAPVSNLIFVAEIILAERTLYTPSIAFSVIAALLVVKARPALRRWVVAAVVLWIAGFSVVTVRRNPVWYSTDTVFEELRRSHPESVRLLFGVATQLMRNGQWEEARVWFRRAIEVWPHYGPFLVEYGFYLYQRGEYREADEMVSSAVAYEPRQRDWNRFLIAIRVRAEDWEAALEAVRAARHNLGSDGFFYLMEAESLAQLGRYPEALEAQEAAVRIYLEDSTWETRLVLALLRAAAGDTATALSDLRWAREAQDAHPEVADSLEAAWTGVRCVLARACVRC
jgi:tetratricopeptide (TPR) repeat protein